MIKDAEKVIRFTGSHTFEICDHLKHELYWWPETLLTYRLDFSAAPLNAASLQLMDMSTQQPVSFQLSGITRDESGRLQFADLSFMTDLPSGETRSFHLGVLPEPHREQSVIRAISKEDSLRADTAASHDEPSPIRGGGNEDSQRGNMAVSHREPSPIRITKDEGSLWIDNGVFSARIPDSQLYPVQIPGPIMQIAAAGGMKYGNSSVDPGKLRIVEIVTTCLAHGPLFGEFTVAYRFDGGKTYTARLKFVRGMEFVILREQIAGIVEQDEAYFRLHWSGLAPTHRHAPNNPAILIGDYNTPCDEFNWDRIDQPYVGGYSHPVAMWSNGADGEIPFRLSLYEPQAAIVKVNAAAFWNEGTGQSVGAFILDEAGWDDGRYDLFCSWDGFAVRFFYRNGLLSWQYPIVGSTRTTAIAVYPHEKDIAWFERVRPRQPEEARYLAGATRMPLHGTSYVIFLQIRYGLISLDKIKDWVLAYPDEARRCDVIFDDCPYPDYESFEQFLMHYILVSKLPTHGQRANAGFSAVPYRRMVNFAKAYNRYHDVMPAPTRRRVEAMLLLLTYLAAGEEVVPLLQMHGGPPNLHGDVKRSLGYMATQFPEHPEAGRWRETFAKFVETSLRLYTRPDLPGLRLMGGRWAETLGTYTWAFLIPALKTAMLLEEQAGMRNMFASPYAAMLGRWLVHAMTAPFDGENEQVVQMMGKLNHYWSCFAQGDGPHRVYPPIGAHAARRTTPRSMRNFAERLARYDPILAENIHYVCADLSDDFESRSTEPPPRLTERDRWMRGTRPDFRTIAFTGYGVMLRGGVYTPDEVSVFVQQIDEGPNYRWGTAGMGGNGNIYYYAGGRAYSHQGKEDAGDRRLNDVEVGCNFGVWKHNRFVSIGPGVITNAYHALGVFQYTAIVPEQDQLSYSYPEYLERNVLLSGTDYISIYDKTGSPAIRNRFTWSVSSFDEMPEIHLLTGYDYRSKLTTGNESSSTDCVWYEGSGDGFAIVSHRRDLCIERRAYGAVVTADGFKDTLFRSHYPLGGIYDGVAFEGTAGAIREYDDGTFEIALIQGQQIRAKGVYLASENGKTGMSLGQTPSGELVGRVSSLGEDRIRVEYEGLKEACLYLDSVRCEPDEDGMYRIAAGEYTVQWVDVRDWPVPAVPRIESVIQGDGACEVKFRESASADRYQVQISDDYGETWRTAAVAFGTECRLDGLENGGKYFVRVCGLNDRKRSEYGHEYPIYPSDRKPLPPEGLDIVVQGDDLALTWGSVLGAQGYRLYRIDPNGGRETIYEGPDSCCACTRVGPGAISLYTVAAVNLCGEGKTSPHVVDDDPTTLRNYKPLIDRYFHRTSLYGHHPFVLQNAHRYREVPSAYPESIAIGKCHPPIRRV